MPARPAPPALAPLAALALALSGCAGREDPNALRNQGEDCLSCHKVGGKAPRSLFTVSGTVFRAADGEPRETGAGQVAVILTDAVGQRLELVSNAAGNFWSKAPLRFPVQVALRALPEGAPRQGPAGRCAHGNCNQCHSYEQPGVRARGRLVRP
jgi:cytochrome c2